VLFKDSALGVGLGHMRPLTAGTCSLGAACDVCGVREHLRSWPPGRLYPSDCIDFYGQVNLYTGVAVSAGGRTCSGQAEYADLHYRTVVSMSAGDSETLLMLDDGFVAGANECFFPFRASVPKGMGTYTFDPGHGARRTLTEAQLARPVILVIGTPPS
jgi:hypothetical protein